MSENKENEREIHDGFLVELLQLIWNLIYDTNSIKSTENPICKKA